METERTWRSRVISRWMVVSSTAILCLSACNRIDSTSASYQNAIDTYYSSHASCLWTEPVRFPVQVDSSDPRELARYNALAEQNLLTRTGTPTALRVAETAATSGFDLAQKGRMEWVADPRLTGFGNLCYGHREAVSIDSATPETANGASTRTVIYRYRIADVPDWAKSPGIQASFPGMGADLSGRQVGRATLTETSTGWVVSDAPWAHIEDSNIYR